MGVDIDREALAWGWEHNGHALLGQPENQMCLVQANVSYIASQSSIATL